MRLFFCLATAALAATMLFAATGNRRVTENKLSPSANTAVTIGGHAVTIEYNAPSARSRTVEGGLVPNDKVWRLGADAATTLTTDADVMIGELRVPKGVHTLYLQGGENGWTLIVNKQTGQWGTVYTQSEDLGRVPMKTTKMEQPVETLKIALEPTGEKSAELSVTWGHTRATVPVKLA